MADNNNNDPILAASLADLLESNPGIAEMDEGIKAYADDYAKAKAQAKAPPQEAPKTPTQMAKGDEEETPADPEIEEEPTETPEGEEEGSIFFGKKGKKASAFKSVEDAQKAFQKTYDIKFDDPNSLAKLYENTKEWRTAAQKLPEIEANFNAIVEDLKNLPPHLANALHAYANGQDEVEAWSATPKQLDFNKPFDHHSKAEIVKYYYPTDWTDEDLSDPDDVAINAAYAKAKTLYNSDKKLLERQRLEYENTAKESKERFANSVRSSVDSLQKAFPGLSTQRVKKVEGLLNGGVQSVLSHFVSGDGTFKKDAGVRLALALFGDEEIKARDGVIDKTNTENYNKVKAAKETPGQTGQTHTPPEKQVPKEILDMSQGIRKTYY